MTALVPTPDLRFGPFVLDSANELVLRGRQRVALTPKAFALLRHLVNSAGRRVAKEELLEAIWPGVYVSDAALKVCISEIRKALADDARRPRFIKTEHRRGYSFVAKVAQLQAGARDSEGTLAPRSQAVARPDLVGRRVELARMHAALGRARGGERQVLFITGEAGIGKTALTDTFLSEVAGRGGAWIARGQCLQHYGAGEPYLPVLEALHELGQTSSGERLVTLLARHAPAWLVQMPSLAKSSGEAGLARETLGATQERMLREMADALEALTMEAPLVLVLEDIHWSDVATLDLVSLLAQRRPPARLLLLATYRPVDVAVSGHPLRTVKQELAAHRSCEELALACLSEAAVAEFLVARLGGRQVAQTLSALLHRRTEGHPLFMVNVVDFLRDQRLIVQNDQRWEPNDRPETLVRAVPESIRQAIDRQIDSLGGEEVRVLQAAAVAGVEFSAAAIAAAVDGDVVRVEECCETMARRELFLRRRGMEEWPDGTVAARYEFIHSLYQNVLYQRMTASHRVLLHRQIGEREEAGWGKNAGAIAAELAAHFEEGRDTGRALRYLRTAAENAARRYANREAIDYLTRAQALVARLPAEAGVPLDMILRERLGMLRRAMGDARRAADDFRVLACRAREEGHSATAARALFYLASTLAPVDRVGCLAAAGQAVELSRGVDDELLRAQTRGSSGYWHSFLRGWRREDAHACAEALATARTAQDPALLSLLLGRYAYFQLLQSAYQETCTTAEEGMRLALEVGDAYEYLFSAFYRALGLLYLGKWGEMLSLVHDGIRMAERNGGAMWIVLCKLQLAWLHQEIGDPGGARPLCESAFEQAREARYPYGQMLSLILLGAADLAEGKRERAFGAFSTVTAWPGGERSTLDWTLQMPLAHGLSEYWLSEGVLSRARAEAEGLADIATQSGERTWLALAQRTLAEVAIAEGQWELADVEVSRALATAAGQDTPLAKWRAHLTAARTCDRAGLAREAREHRARGGTILQALAASLTGADDLRERMLTSRRHRELLQRG